MTIPLVTRHQARIIVLSALLLHHISNSVEIDVHVALNVKGNGFHRNLLYEVNVKELANKHCHVALYLELPPSIYVNVDEVAELERQGKNTICSVGETDVELFTEKAKPQNVTACTVINDSNCTLELPVHLRYHYAKENSDYTEIILPRPKLLLGCKDRIREYRVSKIDLCSPCSDFAAKWREIPFTMDEKDHIWQVPVGDSSLLTSVTCITLLTTTVGAFLIAQTILKSSSREHSKKD